MPYIVLFHAMVPWFPSSLEGALRVKKPIVLAAVTFICTNIVSCLEPTRIPFPYPRMIAQSRLELVSHLIWVATATTTIAGLISCAVR